MSTPTPLQSFLGGSGLSLPVHALLRLNGAVFGISGFVHRAVRGGIEPLSAVLGLVFGGVVVGALEGVGPETIPTTLPRIALSGLLVGMGTKLANGCTSGHMICGLSRFSFRSVVATATFFITGVLTTHCLHPNTSLPTGAMDWTLGPVGKSLVGLQAVSLATEATLYFLAPKPTQEGKTSVTLPQPVLRLITSFITSVNFALALRFSNLTDPNRVISFLRLPLHPGFDPSLAFLALGAIPLSTVLYRYGCGNEKPRLGGAWSVPRGGQVDFRLLFGAAVFGVGWGLEGICPGPGLVNFGRAISGRSDIIPLATWIASVATGGLFF